MRVFRYLPTLGGSHLAGPPAGLPSHSSGDTFERTYGAASQGIYEKVAVWSNNSFGLSILPTPACATRARTLSTDSGECGGRLAFGTHMVKIFKRLE